MRQDIRDFCRKNYGEPVTTKTTVDKYGTFWCDDCGHKVIVEGDTIQTHIHAAPATTQEPQAQKGVECQDCGNCYSTPEAGAHHLENSPYCMQFEEYDIDPDAMFCRECGLETEGLNDDDLCDGCVSLLSPAPANYFQAQDEVFTKTAAKTWSDWLMKQIPTAKTGLIFNANQWWVVWGVDCMGTPQAVQDAVTRHANEERALVESLATTTQEQPQCQKTAITAADNCACGLPKMQHPLRAQEQQHTATLEDCIANGDPTKWREDVEILLHFADDKSREEWAVEIVNGDHSETYGYVFREFAPRVVKAVNSHERLVAALRDADSLLIDCDAAMTDCAEAQEEVLDEIPKIRAEIRAALAEVEKGEN